MENAISYDFVSFCHFDEGRGENFAPDLHADSRACKVLSLSFEMTGLVMREFYATSLTSYARIALSLSTVLYNRSGISPNVDECTLSPSV